MAAWDELIRQYVEMNPRKPGGDEARIVEHHVPVWALIGYLKAVAAARAYYECNKAVIEARLAANAV